jgi:hypothetical protein
MTGRQPLLLDTSRMVWRRWTGRLPTGIDRVCLAWLDHFGPVSQAVLQWRGRFLVLCPRRSQHLFGLIRDGQGDFRRRFAAMVPGLVSDGVRPRDRAGRIYCNIGHTGLDHPALPRWIARHDLRAVFLLHDLIPITHPEFCRAGEAERHTRRIRHALIAGAGIIANSAATLDELATFAHEQGVPLPPSLSAWISGPALPQGTGLPNSAGFPKGRAPARLNRPWFIAVGTIEGRKNHALL